MMINAENMFLHIQKRENEVLKDFLSKNGIETIDGSTTGVTVPVDRSGSVPVINRTGHYHPFTEPIYINVYVNIIFQPIYRYNHRSINLRRWC